MAKQHAGPTPRSSIVEGPLYFPPWAQEFNTRSSWGPHPRAHHEAKPQREYHIDNGGPNYAQDAELHARDD